MRTLHDARDFILKLPKATADKKEWQAAIETLLLAANGGPVDFARIGLMQALHPKGEPAYRSRSKEPVWRNRHRLVRDR
ncbi:hypothetical protein ONR75_10435 [Rhodopseudomonas sp. P2A-2r]|uniref:hypothetical protein n=1 Tax=Rhodopseudomonas sp. P2A-2r TaxID=2991972 RepID=UPI0022348E47|nr:hypothetical protein [Rhodopseudomonas sp. P2A-2r]UZE50993.1 hypothetical protein ONR75_10435 [Rhodopseudomonas sp. P2A-2r]